MRDDKPPSLLKRAERYFSAAFKLGRTARLAKSASHSATVLEPRIDALTQDLYELVDRHEELEGVRDAVSDLERRIAESAETVAREAERFRADTIGDRERLAGAVSVGERHDAEIASLRDGTAELVRAVEWMGERVDAAAAAPALTRDLLLAKLDALREVVETRLGVQGDRITAIARSLETLAPRLDALGGDLDALRDRVTGGETHFRGLQDAFRRASDDAHGRLSAVEGELGQRVTPALERLDAAAAAAGRRLDRTASDIAQTGRGYAELSRRLDLQRFRGAEAATDTPPAADPARDGLDALLESFYGRLEDRYRGAREEIKGRLAVYLPDIRAAAEATGALPVLDLGCGRGEWVELLAEQGIPATGIDLNPVQIAEARAAGLDVREGDALRALAEAADGSLSAVTAHHLIEHLPFETVAWMTREALRVLAPGGVLIYETPNCHNLIVGARSFHNDPTHLSPLPSELMTTLLDTVGYHPVEARPLHPSETLDAFRRESRADPYIAELLFGPQDLAVLGHRPRTV